MSRHYISRPSKYSHIVPKYTPAITPKSLLPGFICTSRHAVIPASIDLNSINNK